MSDVREQIFDLIAKSASIERSRITLESTLKDLEVDSIDAVQMIFDLEEHFDISLPDRDPDFDTASVRGLVEAVEKTLAAKGGDAGAVPVATA